MAIALALCALLAAAGCYAWLRRRRSVPERAIEGPEPQTRLIERQLATQIEGEILRRAALRHDDRGI
jgi:uncharacterized iron-regulated membrane protein